MKFKIYNCKNQASEVDTGDKEIEYITVEVISGNEKIYIHWADGTGNYFRSTNLLLTNYDGFYDVPKERIQEWINLEEIEEDEIPKDYTIGKYRLEKFRRVFDVYSFADFLANRYKKQYGEDITILKINKILYFCFAYWGAYVRTGKINKGNIETDYIKVYNEYLFDTEFIAGAYGPFIKNLKSEKNKYKMYYKNWHTNSYDIIFKVRYDGEVYKFLEPLIRDTFKANEFDLMDITMKDEEYKRAKNKNYAIMDNDKIIDEYLNK